MKPWNETVVLSSQNVKLINFFWWVRQNCNVNIRMKHWRLRTNEFIKNKKQKKCEIIITIPYKLSHFYVNIRYYEQDTTLQKLLIHQCDISETKCLFQYFFFFESTILALQFISDWAMDSYVITYDMTYNVHTHTHRHSNLKYYI